MGSLTSRPSVPSQPQVVTVSQPAPAPAPVETVDTPDPEEASREARRQSLLDRDRSRFGTVRTSFRGLLQDAGNEQRKTLLGE